VTPVPTRGGARVARGLSAASVCALLTYGGHRAAGGALPDLGLLIVLALLLAGFLITLADRRRGPLAILVLVGGSQLALHGLLQLLGGSHEHTASAVSPGSPGLPGTGPLAVPALMPVLMLGAHALATVITAAVLAGAEAAVFTVAHALARVLPLALSMPRTPEPPGRPGVVTGPLDARLRGVLGRRLHLRRGPPPRCPVTAGY
jgi:hypothetical protein